MTGRPTPAVRGGTDEPIRIGAVPGTDSAAGRPGPVPAS
jgi:hypothetical protein